MKNWVFAFFLVSLGLSASSQNTVGLISYDPDKAVEGYNLYFPHNQTNVYLMDNCGTIAHMWEDSIYRPGNSVYLQEDGSIFRCGGRGAASNAWIHAGGGGEVIEKRDWDNNLLWRFTYNDSTKRAHHDIAPLPNGNVLIIAWELKSFAECIQAGRDTALLSENALWPEHIVEVQPNGATEGNIVWEWHAWDHLVQDFDSSKANYGVIAEHPELIDLNFTDDGDADWHHANSIDYNEFLDQIVLSVPTFNEFWIIDHSTTTAQAAGHSGGLSGKGGDLIYRWGNPLAYDSGDSTDQKSFFQHDVHWVDMNLSSGDPDYGKIMFFNNRSGGDYSSVTIVNPVFDSYEWNYPMSGNVWGPVNYDWNYTKPTPTDMFSGGLSSAQRLKNGNTLICAGRQGYNFEITPDEEIVWEFINPMVGGAPAVQYDSLPNNANIMFRMKRYPASFPAFSGRDLSSKGFIEQNPDTNYCSQFVAVEPVLDEAEFAIYPNPFSNKLSFQSRTSIGKPYQIEVLNLFGQVIASESVSESSRELNTDAWPVGTYIIRVNGNAVGKFLLMR